MNNMEWLQWYLISVGFYYVVELVLMNMFMDRITENGWFDDNDDEYVCSNEYRNPYSDLFILCCIPIFRLWHCLTAIRMAFVTKEEYEKSLEDE